MGPGEERVRSLAAALNKRGEQGRPHPPPSSCPCPLSLTFMTDYVPDNGWAGHKDNERFNLNSLESYLFLIIFHDCSSALRDALKSQTTASSSETDRLPQTLPSANAWTLKRSVLAAGLPSP